MDTLEAEFKDDEKFEAFKKKRMKTVLILKEHGMRSHLGPKLRPELVELNKKAGERLSRGGFLYRKEVWESMHA